MYVVINLVDDVDFTCDHILQCKCIFLGWVGWWDKKNKKIIKTPQGLALAQLARDYISWSWVY